MGRVPPHSLEAEISLLGAILVSPERIMDQVVGLLDHRDFYDQRNEAVFRAAAYLHRNSRPVDYVTVAEALRDNGKFEQAGGGTHLAGLQQAEPTGAHALHHAKIIKAHSIRRQVIARAAEAIEQAHETGVEARELVEAAATGLLGIMQNGNRNQVLGIREAVNDAFRDIERRVEAKGELSGLPSGYTDLDLILAGLQAADLIIMAGRPSMGKTALALNMAANLAVNEHPVLVFSLEQSAPECAKRLLCSRAKVDSQQVRMGRVAEADWQPLVDAAGALSEVPIWIVERSQRDVMEIVSTARQAKRELGIKAVFIDYLGLIGTKRNNRRDRFDLEVGRNCKRLKDLAKELNIPVVLLAQLNRKLEERNNKRPRLSDLRDSGEIEQHADVVLFIYRDEVYNPKSEDKGLAEIIIAKQRNGPTGAAKLVWGGRYTRFDNLDWTHRRMGK